MSDEIAPVPSTALNVSMTVPTYILGRCIGDRCAVEHHRRHGLEPAVGVVGIACVGLGGEGALKAIQIVVLVIDLRDHCCADCARDTGLVAEGVVTVGVTAGEGAGSSELES